MTIELKVWQYVLSVLVAFECGIFFIMWWMSLFPDTPELAVKVESKGIEADAAKFLLEGKL